MFELKPLPRSLTAALRDVASPKQAVRLSAIADLTRHARNGERAAGEALERALEDVAEPVRAAAAMALADADYGAALPRLLGVARNDVVVRVRQMALLALGELASPAEGVQDDAVDASQLSAPPPWSPSPAERAEVLQVVTEALQAEAAPERFQSLLALHQLRAPNIRPALIEATVDPDAEVRRLAFRVAEAEWAEAELPEILRARARLALSEAQPLVRVAAALLLGRFGDASGTGVLLALVERSMAGASLEDEQAAIELCAELGVQSAVPALERRAFARLLKDTLAFDAQVALARLGHARARAEILRGLSAFTFHARTLAVVAVVRAEIGEALPRLKQLAATPGRVDAQVLADALAALSDAVPNGPVPSVSASSPRS